MSTRVCVRTASGRGEQGVGIEHHGLREALRHGLHQCGDVRRPSQAGADRDHGLAFGGGFEIRIQRDDAAFGFAQRFGHQLRRVHGDLGDRARGRRDRDQPGAGAQRGHAGHGGGARFAARAGDHERVAVRAFVPGGRARRQQVAEHRGFQQRKPHVLIQAGRAADGANQKFAGLIAVGRYHLRDFGRGEGHGGIGARDFAGGRARVARHAGRNIDRDHLRQGKLVVDGADAFEHQSRGGAGDAGAEQGIDHHRGAARFHRDLAMHRAAAGGEHAIVGGGIALQLFGRRQQHDVHFARAHGGAKLARDYHAIAAIVALAAEHHDALLRERSEALHQEFEHAVSGILHQNDARDSGFDCEPVDFAHFGRGQNFHMRRTTTMVISSCNSPAPVHCTTASMVRAINSAESALEYLTSRSLRRSSPNISP